MSKLVILLLTYATTICMGIETQSYDLSFIDRVVNFRYKPYHPAWRRNLTNTQLDIIERMPRIFSLFDWVIWNTKDTSPTSDVYIYRTETPRTVLINNIHNLPRNLSRIHKVMQLPALQAGERRSLVLAGSDTHLSGVPGADRYPSWLKVLNLLSEKFSLIWYEAKNIEPESNGYPNVHVSSLPVGLNSHYIVVAGEEAIESVIRDAARRSKPENPPRRRVCAAWGAFNSLEGVVSDRAALARYVHSHPDVVNRSHWGTVEYWNELSHCKYFLAPHGTGVQSSKPYECWLVGTIPVVTDAPAYRDLKQMGFPILILPSWDKLSISLLDSMYDTQFMHVNWTNVRHMLTPESVFSRIKYGNFVQEESFSDII